MISIAKADCVQCETDTGEVSHHGVLVRQSVTEFPFTSDYIYSPIGYYDTTSSGQPTFCNVLDMSQNRVQNLKNSAQYLDVKATNNNKGDLWYTSQPDPSIKALVSTNS